MSLGIFLDEKKVEKTVREWAGDKSRASVKYDEFNKVFKGIGNEPVMQRSQVKSHKTA